jgi:D-alanyl-D-alanine carboxypeptidase (penicillin-binding protein 5/6)
MSPALGALRRYLWGLGAWFVAAGGLVAFASAVAAPGPMATAGKKEEFQTAAPYAILIDAESGSILYEKNADQLMAPSSMAKLMTAEVVFNEIKQGRLSLDTEFAISEDAWRRGGAPSHTSSMFAPIHSRVRVQDLLYGVIVQSANDACIALAEGIAGSEPRFAEMMNKRARELGLTRSYFSNATGLPDPTLKVTARELAKLARHIIRTYPEFYPIYSEKEFTWNKIRQQNRNPLLAMNIGADGMKTGFTQAGGYGMVGSAVQNGLRLIVVVNGLKTAAERANEAKRLLEWGFKGFEARFLFADGQSVGDARLYGGAQTTVPLVAPGAVSLLVPRGSTERVLARIVYTGPVRAPVEKGQTIGLLKVWRGDNAVLEVPLQAAESVGKGGLTRRAFDAVTELVIGLFLSGTKHI